MKIKFLIVIAFACVVALQVPSDAKWAAPEQWVGGENLGGYNPVVRYLIARGEEQVKVRNVAVFVHEGVELLDFAGPGEVFAAARTPQGGHAFNVYTVAASADPVTSQGFVSVRPQYTLENAPRPDIVVLPGGNTGIPLQNPKVVEWVKRTSQDAEVMMSVCTGAFLLARAGLLEGQQATTHWGSIGRLRTVAPKTTVLENIRFVDNGRVVTTAGVSAGIDGALHVVDRLLGREAATGTARYMEYKWSPEKLAATEKPKE
jgi:transcriptional regulator GlxA family with amidase domain